MSTKSYPLVGVIMGSQSDWPVMKKTCETLDRLGISNEARILSAHRKPEKLLAYVGPAREAGMKGVIGGAGGAAHLPGVIASMTALPVLGVPMSSQLDGLDSLLSIVQMPKGIPVGTLAIGNAGAINAALLAASIIALSDEKVASALDDFRTEQSADGGEIPVD
jgi:5-(carboxyamino)imidazole ribonucleotide mutase